MNVTFVDFDEVPLEGKELAEIIVLTKLCASKSEARRHIKNGAIKLAEQKVRDPFARLVEVEGKFFLMQKKV